ncbi:unnamed protein product [Darwinula stevensoni]|uniref:Synembryn-A n=1 Tax=Darwinula stevensoni TaxID=69355 RepID=A0A7R8X7V5_9CRUS|nr:unnamed protein product [Darwinula stevensoni]CAG0880915.1 unnamed protein product [Darwinula stevensoni]
MMEKYLEKLEGSSELEAKELLTTFTEEYGSKFTFPELSEGNLRVKFWSLLQKLLQDNEKSGLRKQCLEVVRILSRERAGLDSALQPEMIAVLLDLSFLKESSGSYLLKACKQGDSATIIEAQKCLCNLTFHSDRTKEALCTEEYAQNLIARLKMWSSAEIPYDVKFFDVKLLFIVTAVSFAMRTYVRDYCNGISIIGGGLQRVAGCDKESSKPLVLTVQDSDLCCEILKVLFNVCSVKDLTEEDEKRQSKTLVESLRKLLLSTGDKKEETVSNVVNLLTVLDGESFQVLTTPMPKNAKEKTTIEYDGINVSAIHALLAFLDGRLENPQCSKPLAEAVCPALKALIRVCRANRYARKYLRKEILPPLRDVMHRPEEGNTIRGKLCRLLTSPHTGVKDLAAELLFVLCKERVARLVKYAGYGNSAGMLAAKGLMLGGNGMVSDYSSEEEDSDTEEYLEAQDQINPITGCYEEPHENPMEKMTDEQKEYEAMKLVNLLDKMNREGVIQPMRVGEDGRPHRIEHVLELQEHLPQNFKPQERQGDQDSDSD